MMKVVQVYLAVVMSIVVLFIILFIASVAIFMKGGNEAIEKRDEAGVTQYNKMQQDADTVRELLKYSLKKAKERDEKYPDYPYNQLEKKDD